MKKTILLLSALTLILLNNAIGNISFSGVALNGLSTDSLVLSFGIFADAHQQQSDDPGYYNNYSDEKLVLASTVWESINGLDFAIGMGDLIDSTVSAEDDILNIIEMDIAFANYTGTKYNIIGNHETEELSLEEFISNSAYTSDSYHSFDINNIHCIILNGGDAGNYFTMSDVQLTWLENDLISSNLKTLVFIHYRIDQNYPGDPEVCLSGTYNPPTEYCYSAFSFNAEDIREKIEADGDVIAVFQGHHHRNAMATVNGIKYFTLAAMTAAADSNAYATVYLYMDNSIVVNGVGRQVSYQE